MKQISANPYFPEHNYEAEETEEFRIVELDGLFTIERKYIEREKVLPFSFFPRLRKSRVNWVHVGLSHYYSKQEAKDFIKDRILKIEAKHKPIYHYL